MAIFQKVSLVSILLSLLSPEGVHIISDGHEASSEHKICILEDTSSSLYNTSQNIVTAALQIAFQHIKLHKALTLNLTRIGVTSDSVFEIATLDQKMLASCTGLLIIADCPMAGVLSEMATELKLLHLLFNPGIFPCHINSRYFVDLSFSEEVFINRIKKMVLSGLKWRRVLFLYDLFLLRHRSALAMFKIALSETSVKFKVLPLEHTQTEADLLPIVPMLKDVYQSFVFLDPKDLDLFIQVAANNSLLEPQHQWFLVSRTTCREALGKTVLMDSNTILLKATHITNSSDYIRCPGVKLGQDKEYITLRAHLMYIGFHILLKGSMAHMSWSCVGYTSHHTHIFPENFLELLLLPDHRPRRNQENALLTVTTSEGQVSIDLANRVVSSVGLEYCSSDSKEEQGYTFKGQWKPSENTTMDSMFENVFTDFENATLYVAMIPAPPFVIKTTEENDTVRYIGFCVDLLDELARRLKFRYKVVDTHDGQFGSMNKDKSWSGLVGMVINKEITMGIGPISITSERKSVIDFTTAFAEDGIGIITRQPGLGSSKMFQLFRPFQTSVWICVVGLVIVTSVVLYLVNRMSPLSSRGFSRSASNKLTLFHCFWAILASSVNQGTDLQPMSQAARMVLGFWWVFIIIVVSTYTASLAAVLTVTVNERSINSLIELSEQSDIQPLIKPGTNLETLFETATNEIYQSIASRLVLYPANATNEKAMVWVKESNMAFMTDRSQLEYTLQRECEMYTLADEVFNSGGLGFVVPKNAEFLDALNLIIVKLRQAGIMEAWRSKWWRNDEEACSKEIRVSEGEQLDLVYLAGPFFVFVSSLVLSVLVALCDWAWRKGKLRPVMARLRRWAAPSGDSAT